MPQQHQIHCAWTAFLSRGQTSAPPHKDRRAIYFKRYFINRLHICLFASNHARGPRAMAQLFWWIAGRQAVEAALNRCRCAKRGFTSLDFNHLLMIPASVYYKTRRRRRRKRYLIINWRWTIRAMSEKLIYIAWRENRMHAQERLSSPGRRRQVNSFCIFND